MIMVLNNKGIALSNIKKFKEAEDLFRQTLTIEPNNCSALYNFGVTKYEQKEYDAALMFFDKVPETCEEYTDSIFSKGKIFLDTKKLKNAIDVFNSLITLNPSNANALAHRGIAYAMSKNIKQALLDFDEALDIDPANYFALENKKRLVGINSNTNIEIEKN
ncbi:MAG: tetratricopeptide repeat protein [Thaumarchaeota archaeon]|nr:tetratricopeptide repeat protein [Nitrososphaerota archaeon]